MLLKDSLFQAILTVYSEKGEVNSTNFVGNVGNVQNDTSDVSQGRGTFEKYDRAPHLYLHYTLNTVSFKTCCRGKNPKPKEQVNLNQK